MGKNENLFYRILKYIIKLFKKIGGRNKVKDKLIC